MKAETTSSAPESFFTWLTTPPDGALVGHHTEPRKQKQQPTSTKAKQVPTSPSPPKVYGKILPGGSSHGSDGHTSLTVATTSFADSDDDDDSLHSILLPSHVPTPQTLEFEMNDLLPIANIVEDAWGGIQQGLKGLNTLLQESPQQHYANGSNATKPASTCSNNSGCKITTTTTSPVLSQAYWHSQRSKLGDGSRVFCGHSSSLTKENAENRIIPPPPLVECTSDNDDNDDSSNTQRPASPMEQRDDNENDDDNSNNIPTKMPLLQQQWWAEHPQNLHGVLRGRSSIRVLDECIPQSSTVMKD